MARANDRPPQPASGNSERACRTLRFFPSLRCSVRRPAIRTPLLTPQRWEETQRGKPIHAPRRYLLRPPGFLSCARRLACRIASPTFASGAATGAATAGSPLPAFPSAFLPISAVYFPASGNPNAPAYTAETGRNAEGKTDPRTVPLLAPAAGILELRTPAGLAHCVAHICLGRSHRGGDRRVAAARLPLCVSSDLCGVLSGVRQSERPCLHRRDGKKRRGENRSTHRAVTCSGRRDS